jgi:hypothetical protein
MESESGAKIAIRGKGSVKEGKGRSDAAHTSNQEEDLHCLIMADTEEKVNKAKKLIHNVIETVSQPLLPEETLINAPRPLLFLKARTNSSATSFVSLLPSTVPSVTTRTRPARTAVKSVTASTTAHRSRISLPVLSVVSVVKLDIWLAIVLIARSASPGATTTASAIVLHKAVSAERPKASSMPSLPKSGALVVNLVVLSNITGTVAVAVATTTAEENATSSLGSVAQLVVPHHGLAMTETIVVTATAILPPLHLGLVAAVAAPALTLVNHMVVRIMVMEAVAVRLLGLLLLPLLATVMAVMATTRARLVWALPAHTVLQAMVLQQLPLVLLQVLDRSSRTTRVTETYRLLHLRLILYLHLLPLTRLPRHHRLLSKGDLKNGARLERWAFPIHLARLVG